MDSIHKCIVITPEEYLEGEKISQVKHEYAGGEVYAMVGASKPHNRISGALYAALRAHLRGGPCDVFALDMKVRARFAGADAFYYPDVVVDCQASDSEPYFTETPLLVAEVLSKSTKAVDEREKRLVYQGIETLREYLLLDQNRPDVRVYRRMNLGEAWTLESAGEGDAVRLESIELTIPIADIYAGAWR